MLEEHQSACPIPLLEKLDETGIEEISSFGSFFLSHFGHRKKKTPLVAAYCGDSTRNNHTSAGVRARLAIGDCDCFVYHLFIYCFQCVFVLESRFTPFCTRLSPVCSLLHFMVPAYSESVYATDVLRLYESAFSSPTTPKCCFVSRW